MAITSLLLHNHTRHPQPFGLGVVEPEARVDLGGDVGDPRAKRDIALHVQLRPMTLLGQLQRHRNRVVAGAALQVKTLAIIAHAMAADLIGHHTAPADVPQTVTPAGLVRVVHPTCPGVFRRPHAFRADAADPARTVLGRRRARAPQGRQRLGVTRRRSRPEPVDPAGRWAGAELLARLRGSLARLGADLGEELALLLSHCGRERPSGGAGRNRL